MSSQSNLNFHQTFKPEIHYISSVLSIADGDKALEVKDISNMTGIPNGKSSGKVEPHIIYAKYMGLIDYKKENGKYILERTPLGEVVFSEDPGLQEKLTLLLCHALLCRKENGADVWKTVFNSIMPIYKTGIRKELVLKELEVVYKDKINTKNLAPFWGSYEDMFCSLGILDAEGEIVKTSSLPYDKEYIYLYALVLFTLWDEMIPNEDEISSIQLESLEFRKLFCWDDEQQYKVLESLSDTGIIRLNRQLMPYTILRLTSMDFLREKLYSELC